MIELENHQNILSKVLNIASKSDRRMEAYEAMNLSDENRLLLYCTKTEISESKLDQIKKLITLPLNWEKVLQSALWHGVAPLAYHNLKDIEESKLIPKEVMDSLKSEHHRNLAKNMHLYSELNCILEAFRENGIKVVVLKGTALAKTVYSNMALRPMSDIDLLIKKDDISLAEQIMSDLGYRFEDYKSPEWYKENHFHLCYFHPEKSATVEIHWHIGRASHPTQIAISDNSTIERLWERARAIEIGGMETLVLSPDDLLFHLSLHFFKHRFINGAFTSKGALIQLCDIVHSLKDYKNEFDWASLRREAERTGTIGIISSTLYIVRELYDANDDILDEALSLFRAESVDGELLRLIQKRIFVIEDSMPSSFLQSLAANKVRNKVKSFLQTVFPHREVLSKRYSIPSSSKKLYLYYMFRPFRLLIKYRKLLWKSIVSREDFKEEVILTRWINSKN